jgi:hypothetical protein
MSGLGGGRRISLAGTRHHRIAALSLRDGFGFVNNERLRSQSEAALHRAIYRLEDQRIGQWSAEASVIVGG